jgi:hypothetical protein
MVAHIVPAELAEDVESIVEAARTAALAQGLSLDDELKIARPPTRDMVPGATEAVFFILGSGATWFTSKWFDTFVWPVLEKHIRKPSEAAVAFVEEKLGGR